MTKKHSQTLTASCRAFYPEYALDDTLYFGCEAAPNLTFNRYRTNRIKKDGTVNMSALKSLKELSRELKKRDFTLLPNEEFEVAFETRNRNDNQEYALLFTPLAQENMLKILKENSHGFGDYFAMEKKKKLTTLINELFLSVNGEYYSLFGYDEEKISEIDYQKARKTFLKTAYQFFRRTYFAFAPLLAVPLYQQMRTEEEIYHHEVSTDSSYLAHEVVCNGISLRCFKHPDCVTECILKTRLRKKQLNGEKEIEVTAYGFRREPRLYVERVKGDDGKYHDVEVEWYEYFPVTKTTSLYIGEFTELLPDDISQSERKGLLKQRLKRFKHNLNIGNITCK